MRITSTQNPAVKHLRLLDRASARREHGEYLAEGVRLLGEALATGQNASLVLYDPEHLSRSAAGTALLQHIPLWAERSYEADARVLSAAAQTESPGGIVASLRLPTPAPLETHADAPLGLILDGVGDPGNAGTILRTADAFGIGYVVALKGSVDLFSPKVVRSGMGAHFRLPLYQDLTIEDVRTKLPNVVLVAAAGGEGEALTAFTWPNAAALVIGSEAHGLSPSVRDAVQDLVHIPMRPGVESLNAAVAASVIMYAARGSLPEIS